MKQHITKEQYLEISYGQAEKFEDYFVKKGTWRKNMMVGEINIGQMIEYLGDDFININYCHVAGYSKRWFVHIDGFRSSGRKEPINCLWEAVKYKLSI